MENSILIRSLEAEDFKNAVDIFTEGFIEDPLHLLLFPEYKERARVTRCIYEMMVYDIVPGLNIQLKGLHYKNQIAGCLIYTRPDAKVWTEKMNEAVKRMRIKANNPDVKHIGKYAMKTALYKPEEKHIYLNELTVKKQYRQKGLARMLLESAEEDAVMFPDIKKIVLDTTNILNVEIYKKIGYNVFHEFNFLGLTGYSMVKEIKSKEQ